MNTETNVFYLRDDYCMTTKDNGELFIYDEKKGMYLRDQEWRIRALCRSIYHDVNTYTINEVINRVKDWTYAERSEFDFNTNIINVSNGLLNIHTSEFIKHTSNYFSTVQLPIKYDPNAKCPVPQSDILAVDFWNRDVGKR